MKFIVYGGGHFGTSIANIIAKNNNMVVIVVRNKTICDDINNNHMNSKYFLNYKLSSNIKAVLKFNDAKISNDDIVLNAIPIQQIYSFVNDVLPNINAKLNPIISLSKGINVKTKMFASQILNCAKKDLQIAVLGGPNYAKELMDEVYSGFIIGSKHEKLNKKIKNYFTTDYTFVQTVSFVEPIELGGTLKNIYAIWLGIANGLNLCENTKAIISTESIKEIKKIYVYYGYDPNSFDSLFGIGDFILSCYGKLSRNKKFGQILGSKNPNKIFNETAEGIKSVEVMHNLFCDHSDIIIIKILYCLIKNRENSIKSYELDVGKIVNNYLKCLNDQ